ncbi:hypothetical protein LWI29_007145 [Acer saccharum]|uniref:Pectinesterase catalytic domain-containing protein n=1 Tax=Acer saccharum TaxID=4024 RepID=A0AA39VUL6_ACESA|nr:hypothetical protein LWI29_007145 [Acer saccharum]
MVIQNSIIHVRQPLDGQQTMITTNGREDNRKNTPIVIHNCSIIPTPEFKVHSSVKTHLGKPWKKYARTIIMQSYKDDFINPEGWMKFNESSNVTTLYYVEFWKSGPGSNTSGRVKWPGYHNLNNPNDVKDFTAEKFTNGNEWLPKFDVPYSGGLVR